MKICGITNSTDAEYAVDVGADALGFVFAPNTKREVTAVAAAAISRRLPPFVGRVGLFVNATSAKITDTIIAAQLDTIQLHGEESPEFAAEFLGRVRVVKAFRIRDESTLSSVPAYFDVCHAVLLDAFALAGHGGTGVPFDWSLAKKVRALAKPVIIAGGLRPQNVAQAVELFAPYAVDVSSGVENDTDPRRKDPAKIREFIRNARRIVPR